MQFLFTNFNNSAEISKLHSVFYRKMTQKKVDISLDELVYREKLCTGAINVCKNNELTSLQKILDYYFVHKDFLQLDRCGMIANESLCKLCLKYKNHTEKSVENSSKRSTLTTKYSLNKFQINLVEMFLEDSISRLSVRALNSLTHISPDIIPAEIIEVILADNFDFNKKRYFGKRSLIEIDWLRSNIINYIPTTQNSSQRDSLIVLLRLLIKKYTSDLPDNINSLLDNVLDSDNKIRSVAFIKLMLDHDFIFSDVENEIFNNECVRKPADYKTLEIIGKQYKLTRERVRQIRQQLFKQFPRKFLFLNDKFVNNLIIKWSDSATQLVIIDQKLQNLINKTENVDFNATFYRKYFEILLKKNHLLLKYKDANFNKYLFKNQYFIKSVLFFSFDFIGFFKALDIERSKQISKTYTIVFNEYINRFRIGSYPFPLKQIASVCKKIVRLEFDLIVDSNGFLVFKRNTRIFIHEHIIKIIEKHDAIMKGSDIVKVLLKKPYEIKASKSTIRAIIVLHPDVFISFGRNSLYGLRKWENEKKNIKGGTIRNIIEEYLLQEETPKHVSEILAYVLRFRNTNHHSVVSNLRLDIKKRFCLYGESVIGLSYKKYKGFS